ncbi:MAG TPA: lysophospholipid acyltransferase family protein [Burkholderiales bacterium]|nr:lysophospholipid acyltransferase family protein [Burkholderiales bacterium]
MSRVPRLPPSMPRRGNALSRALGRALLALGRWRIEGEFPDRPKLIAIVAPHTSNWDFIIGIAAVYALGLRVRFLGKHTLFQPPLGWLMRWFGGVPVNREAPQGLVPQAVEAIDKADAIFLAITPAGTRSSTRPWRSGFYHIAHAARVPILPVAFDGAQRAIRLFKPVETSGDYARDLPQLVALYAGIRGVNP